MRYHPAVGTKTGGGLTHARTATHPALAGPVACCARLMIAQHRYCGFLNVLNKCIAACCCFFGCASRTWHANSSRAMLSSSGRALDACAKAAVIWGKLPRRRYTTDNALSTSGSVGCVACPQGHKGEHEPWQKGSETSAMQGWCGSGGVGVVRVDVPRSSNDPTA